MNIKFERRLLRKDLSLLRSGKTKWTSFFTVFRARNSMVLVKITLHNYDTGTHGKLAPSNSSPRKLQEMMSTLLFPSAVKTNLFVTPLLSARSLYTPQWYSSMHSTNRFQTRLIRLSVIVTRATIGRVSAMTFKRRQENALRDGLQSSFYWRRANKSNAAYLFSSLTFSHA